eukprot:CAMPEP_0116121310 /NCGR_PEP_ID=MMETSP0329-20121206/3628_1 /TAXON_ID=697910 /ORGANISM="Pseudo-nitzschia arenysensis, Strain B593" /LENGTH=547 /DNA_ID=CAMNT_0003615113 /DNA_START=125 /DNA_END=1765 /DNA_ORIENTATION=+
MMDGAAFFRLVLLPMAIATITTAFIPHSSIGRTFRDNYCGYSSRVHCRTGVDQFYHRRRSRTSIAMSDEQDQEPIQNKPEMTNVGDAGSSPSASCPFSKTFPRYRIDLTSSRKNRKNNKQKEEGGWSLLPIPSIELPSLEFPSPPWKEGMQRDQVQRAVRQQQKRKTGIDSGDMDVVIKTGIDGIEAFTFLWEESARLMGISRDEENSSPSSVVVLGLPDASKPLVQNFCEIVEWMRTTMTPDSDGTTNNSNISVVYDGFVLKADFIQEEENLEIPTVRLERISSPSGPSSSQATAEIDPSASAENIINERTRMWVKRILVELGICPFTKSDRMSGQGLLDLGVPVGSIAYHASFQRHPIGLFADTWKAIDEMIKAGPEGRSGVSSILLAAPKYDDDFDVWAGPIFAMLEAGVVAAGAESQVGVVCFHPRYATPDGKSWPGFGHMHSVPRLEKWYKETTSESSFSSSPSSLPSECILTAEQIAAGGAWQRRTPHATINVLRADQLEAAESRRVSGKMYTENIDKLVGANGIGNEKLASDLQREREEG